MRWRERKEGKKVGREDGEMRKEVARIEDEDLEEDGRQGVEGGLGSRNANVTETYHFIKGEMERGDD